MPLSRRELDFKMLEFYASHHDAKKVLDAYNTVDPFQCYYGDDCNPDEYMGYAIRCLNSTQPTTLDRVRMSFYPSQWIEGWICDKWCEEIATLIGKNWQNSLDA